MAIHSSINKNFKTDVTFFILFQSIHSDSDLLKNYKIPRCLAPINTSPISVTREHVWQLIWFGNAYTMTKTLLFSDVRACALVDDVDVLDAPSIKTESANKGRENSWDDLGRRRFCGSLDVWGGFASKVLIYNCYSDVIMSIAHQFSVLLLF